MKKSEHHAQVPDSLPDVGARSVLHIGYPSQAKHGVRSAVHYPSPHFASESVTALLPFTAAVQMDPMVIGHHEYKNSRPVYFYIDTQSACPYTRLMKIAEKHRAVRQHILKAAKLLIGQRGFSTVGLVRPYW